MNPALLHVEDNLDDRILFSQARQQVGASFELFSVKDGRAALDYLTATGPYADRSRFPVPSALLLDLKMPSLDGFAVIRWIRAQSPLPNLPIVVFTSSYQHADVERAYFEGATSFLTKPSSFEGFLAIARALQQSFASADNQFQSLKSLREYRLP
jgi:CheY-like chemotaxis protein